MAEPITVDNGTLTDYAVLVDDVTDSTLGTGAKQLIGIVDATINSTNKLLVDASNSASVRERRGTTATNTTVADSATSGTLLASNAARVSATVTNDSSARLYVLYGSGTASSTSYTFFLDTGETVVVDDFTGQLTGVWATDPNDGAARVTEVT